MGLVHSSSSPIRCRATQLFLDVRRDLVVHADRADHHRRRARHALRADSRLAFDSIEHIMRDVTLWLADRYSPHNGASMFFLAVYMHIFRGMYYGSYKAPREVLMDSSASSSIS